MIFEFNYTPADIRDLTKVHNKHAPGVRFFGRQNTLGWVAFIAAATALFGVLESHPHSGAHAVAPTSILQDAMGYFSSFAPGIITVGIVVGFAVWQRWHTIHRNPALKKSLVVTIDPDQLHCKTGPASSSWEWFAFDKFVETNLGFYLHIRDSKNWMILPKRVFSDPQIEAQVRQIFESHVNPVASAFPVIPIQ